MDGWTDEWWWVEGWTDVVWTEKHLLILNSWTSQEISFSDYRQHLTKEEKRKLQVSQPQPESTHDSKVLSFPWSPKL